MEQEHFFLNQGKNRLAVSLGFSYSITKLPIPPPRRTLLRGLGINSRIFYTYAFYKLKHHVEVGTGYFYTQRETMEGVIYYTFQGTPILDSLFFYTSKIHTIPLLIGYRFQKPSGGLLFKIGVFAAGYFINDRRNKPTDQYSPYFKKGFSHYKFRKNEILPLYIGIGWSF